MSGSGNRNAIRTVGVRFNWPTRRDPFGALPFFRSAADFCFTNSRPWRLAHQSGPFPSFANFGTSIAFFAIGSLPSHSPGQVVPFLPGIQIVRGDDPNPLAPLDHDSGQQSPGIRFAVVYVAQFSLHILLIDQNRAIREALFYLVGFDPMRPDLAQIALVPVEHRTSIVYATHDKWTIGAKKRAYRRKPRG